jgi:DNA-binding NarL/FixJ family response regulator
MPNPIRIIIAEDHALVRQSISSFLNQQDDITMVGEAGNGEELLALLNSRPADLILLDLHMPVMNGAQALDVITKRFPDIKVIIISMDFGPFLLDEYIRKGAHGFIPKGCEVDVLLQAIDDIKTQGNCIAISKSLIKTKAPAFANSFGLTKKQLHVLSLTCKGVSNAEIGSMLNITTSAVEFHKKNIYLKTGLKSQADVIAYGIKNGLDML